MLVDQGPGARQARIQVRWRWGRPYAGTGLALKSITERSWSYMYGFNYTCFDFQRRRFPLSFGVDPRTKYGVT
jgi:hypothetical protein